MILGLQLVNASSGGILELSKRIAEISPEEKTQGLDLPANDTNQAQVKSEQLKQNLRRQRTYELKSLPDKYLRPVAISTNSSGTKPNITEANSDRYEITWSMKLPMFEWLNSQNIGGTTQTPATAPCAMASNEYPSGGPNQRNQIFPNWLNLYSIDLPLPAQSMSSDKIDGIPFQFNGIGCLIGYESGRNILGNRPQLASITQGGYDVSAGSELISGKAELNAAQAFSNLLDQANLDALADSQKVYRDTNPEAFTGTVSVNSLYKGDVSTTPAFQVAQDPTLKILHSRTTPQSIQIPYLLEALKSAFKLQHTLRTQTFAVNTKFIQRNNVGVQIEITKNIYDKQARTGGVLGQLQPLTVSFDDADINAELDKRIPSQSPKAYISFTPATRSEKAVLTFPWFGQIREIMRRYSLVESGRVETDINRVRQNRVNYLDPIMEAIKNTSLSTPAIGISAGGSFDVKRLLNNSNSSNPFVGSDLYNQMLASVRNDLIIYTCQDLDSLATAIDNLPNKPNLNGSDNNAKKSNLAQILRQTDCWDSIGDLKNPLQEFLCGQGLEAIYCQGYGTQADIGEICTPFDSSDVPNLEGGSGDTSLSASSPTVVRGSVTGKISQRHPAVDLAIGIGTPVRSIASCQVVYAGRTTAQSEAQYNLWYSSTVSTNPKTNPPVGVVSNEYQGFGNTILLQCPVSGGNLNNSFECERLPGEDWSGKRCIAAVYAHLNGISQGVVPGALVNRDQPLGVSGNTGNSLGPHLHFELRKKLRRNSFVAFTRSDGSGPTVYGFQDVDNPANDPNYIDPTCLLSGECKLSLSGAGFIPGAGGSIGNQVCAEPTTTGSIIVARNAPAADLTKIREEVNSNCGNNSNTCNYLRNGLDENYSQILGAILARTGDLKGNNPATGTGNPTYSIIKAVAEAVKAPPEKIAAHLHIENYGANQPNARITNRFNGNLDQVLHAEPNGYGCLGPGQFCPGTLQAYFHPTGRSYSGVLKCVQRLGFAYQDGDVIDPTYVGTAICATSSKLSNDKNSLYPDPDWSKGCCDQSGNFTSDSCPHFYAARRYFGGVNGVYGKAADETSNVCREDSLISKYKSEMAL